MVNYDEEARWQGKLPSLYMSLYNSARVDNHTVILFFYMLTYSYKYEIKHVSTEV